MSARAGVAPAAPAAAVLAVAVLTVAVLTVAAAAGIACGERADPASSHVAARATAHGAAPPTAPAPAHPPADSLVATAPGGSEIWFTLARGDSGTLGRCTARAVEIRHGARRVAVPLLYTRAAPEILNDTTMRARLSDHCAPGDRYLVDLRTGRPVRER